MKKAELLAPAGNMEKFKMALHYGADAVFLGGKMFNLRAGSNNFSDEELVYYLEKNNGDVRKASYECLILKAETTGLDVSGVSTKDSSSYFKMLAQKYVTPNTGTLL